jgi:ribosomal protein S27AE
VTQVFIAQHPAEAHFVRGLLEADGIAAEVHGESLFGARGEAPATPDTLPSVWVVDDTDAPKAAVILAAFGRQGTPDIALRSWRCPKCGETVEGQFTDCWHCGAGRPTE